MHRLSLKIALTAAAGTAGLLLGVNLAYGLFSPVGLVLLTAAA